MSTSAASAAAPSAQYASPPPVTLLLIAFLLVFFFLGIFFVIFCQCCIQTLWQNRRAHAGGAPVGPAGTADSPGIDPSIIESFPTFTYSSVKDYRNDDECGLECAICLAEFEDMSLLRLLTSCNHVFHQECIDLWLESHKTCPVCRRALDGPAKGGATSPAREIYAGDDAGGDAHSVVTIVDDNSEILGPDDDNPTLATTVTRVATLDNNPEQPGKISGRRECVVTFNTNTDRDNDNDSDNNAEEKFSRSHSTGHSIGRSREDEDRFTLRLPEHVRAKIIRGHNATKSCTTFGERKSKRTKQENVGSSMV